MFYYALRIKLRREKNPSNFIILSNVGESGFNKTKIRDIFSRKQQAVERGEEGQPHQSLVRTTFSSFSRPNHIKSLVLSILFFSSVRSLKINTFFKNMATLGHR